MELKYFKLVRGVLDKIGRPFVDRTVVMWTRVIMYVGYASHFESDHMYTTFTTVSMS